MVTMNNSNLSLLQLGCN